MIIPNMGSAPSAITDVLFSPVQARLLGLLFAQPDRRFQSAELIRLAAGGTGAAHRQLKRLSESGLLIESRVGNQIHYQANRSSPVFADLHGLIIKTIGLVEPLRTALEPLVEKIHVAFVYGSIPKGVARTSSDVDLMILSDALSYHDAFAALQPVEQQLGRPVNPTVASMADWQKKSTGKDSLFTRLLQEPKRFRDRERG